MTALARLLDVLMALFAGIGGAMIGIVVALAAQIIYTLGVLVPQMRQQGGSGGIGAVAVGIASPMVVLATLIGFAVGVWWQRRRARRLRLEAGRPSA